jgi:hypothetical protein
MAIHSLEIILCQAIHGSYGEAMVLHGYPLAFPFVLISVVETSNCTSN